jgi:hypothetical protein
MIRINDCVEKVLAAPPSSAGPFLEAGNALVREGIRNPVRVLRRLNKLGLISYCTDAVDTGQPLLNRWVRLSRD